MCIAHVAVDFCISVALADLSSKYGGSFNNVTINVGSNLEPLFSESAMNANRMIDLSFLKELILIGEDEKFLVGDKIYVRDCMRKISRLFQKDVECNKKGGRYATAFIGSPGVGKSVLCFLLALYQAQTKSVVYYRCTGSDGENVSLFVMTPARDKNHVHVWFNRNMERTFTIDDIQWDVKTFIPRETCYVHIDGPRYDDKENTLYGMYDYLCTSGGFRLFKSEETGKRLWILDGWKEDEVVGALEQIGETKSSALDYYKLCGGCIRLIFEAKESGKAEIEKRLKKFVSELDSRVIEIAIVSSTRDMNRNVPDRLRTMFSLTDDDDEYRMTAIQIVDSQYVLTLLKTSLGVESYLNGYNLSVQSSMDGSMTGMYFERVVHSWFKNMAGTKSIVTTVCEPVGTKKESTKELTHENMYWIPSVSNYANIDSALANNGTLFVFQMTIADTHSFNDRTFTTDFVDEINVKSEDSTKVTFNTEFLNHVNHDDSDQSRDIGVFVYFVVPASTTKFALPPTMFCSKAISVDMENLATLDSSMNKLLHDINGTDHTKTSALPLWFNLTDCGTNVTSGVVYIPRNAKQVSDILTRLKTVCDVEGRLVAFALNGTELLPDCKWNSSMHGGNMSSSRLNVTVVKRRKGAEGY